MGWRMIPHLTLDGAITTTLPRSKASCWGVFSRTIRDCYPGKSRLIEVLSGECRPGTLLSCWATILSHQLRRDPRTVNEDKDKLNSPSDRFVLYCGGAEQVDNGNAIDNLHHSRGRDRYGCRERTA